MCGIAGVLRLGDDAPPPTRDEATAMISAVRHRGPDEFGLYLDRWASIGQARLSIIDLATGQQPMTNEDGTLWLVYNGELFNYVELREELIACGHRFRTASDTEVVVHAYEEWGDRAFARFNGQFAVALWSSRDRTLVLARDRLGVRPLYLCAHRGRLWFASEIKAIFAGDPSIPRALDPIGVAETFTFWTPVAPQTVFTGITELEPGHVRRISPSGVEDHAYWSPPEPAPGSGPVPSLEEAVEGVRTTLEEAVRVRMLRADVPVGSYLSGGLDSSLVAALARRATGTTFNTFSVSFEDAEFDEAVFQRRVADQLETTHHEVRITGRDIAEVFPDVIAHTERPILRTAPAPMFILARLVHEIGIKVVLTGEGADEMFAGYDLFREAKVRRFWGRQPESTIRPRLLERLYPYLARSPVAQAAMAREFFGRDRTQWREPGFGHRPRWQSTAALQRMFSPELRRATQDVDVVGRFLASRPPSFERWSSLAQDQYLEIRTLLSGYLLSSQGDRMAMAHSVEGRFPFLDINVVAYANDLPPSYKVRGLDEKHILKRAAAGLVPDDVIRRSKQPFRAPDARSFTASDRPDWIEEIVSPAAVGAAGIFDASAVERLWRKCLATSLTGPASNADNMAIVGVLSTGLLHERLVRARPRRDHDLEYTTCVDRSDADPADPFVGLRSA